MAKKSTATRQASAARRPQTSGKVSTVKLVRPEGSRADVSAGTSVVERPTQSAPARPAPVARTTAPVKAAPKPTPKPAASAVQPGSTRPASAAPVTPNASARAQLQRAEAAKIARAREMQRARAANLITPEHYGYVKNDLRLIAILASCMFAIIIILHFVLG